MKKSVKILIVVLCLIIVGLAGFIICDKVINKASNLISKNSRDYEDYKGYWYTDKENGETSTEYTELNIKDINNSVITFDYTIAMLCADKDITVDLQDGKGDFETKESTGTIILEDNKVELRVINTHYNNSEIKKVFNYKSSDSRNKSISDSRNNQEKIVGEWKIKRIIDLDSGTDMGYSQHFGNSLAEKYHFEFYNDGTYIMLLGDTDDKGTYEVVGNKVNMYSESGIQKNLEITEDEDNNLILIENETEINVRVYYSIIKETNTQNSSSEQENLSRDEALVLGKKMYKKVEEYYEKMSEIHTEITNKAIGGSETMAKIEDNTFMENVKKVLIKDAFNDFMDYYCIEEKNDGYYTGTGGMGSNPLYINTKDLTIKNIDSNKITYIATSVYEAVNNPDETETKDYEFVLTKIYGEWKVENFTEPY